MKTRSLFVLMLVAVFVCTLGMQSIALASEGSMEPAAPSNTGAVTSILSSSPARIASLTIAKRPVTSIKFRYSVVTVNRGKTLQLSAVVAPATATNKTLRWASSKPDIVKVSSTGMIRGLREGRAFISATARDGSGKKASCVVYVGAKVSNLQLSASRATILTGQKTLLTPTITPTNAANKTVTWASSNSNIARVSTTGTVKGLKAGQAVISAKAQDGGKKAYCVVTVRQAVTGVSLPASTNVLAGGTTTCYASVTPSTAFNKAIAWSSGNPAVAVVNNSGVVTGLRAGSAYITARATDGSGKSDSCLVTVSAVYWVPNGSVYHVSRNCPTLARSKTVYSGSIGQSGKSAKCKVCG